LRVVIVVARPAKFGFIRASIRFQRDPCQPAVEALPRIEIVARQDGNQASLSFDSPAGYRSLFDPCPSAPVCEVALIS